MTKVDVISGFLGAGKTTLIKKLLQEALQDSFKEYQEGMKLLKSCHEAIAVVEQKVQRISEDGSLEDFE